jgi:methyl-accepting chemotaxis protein
MLNWFGNSQVKIALAELAALDKSQARIEFSGDGIILKANQSFLATFGYSLGEIVGKHHSIFVDNDERESVAYRKFWEQLGQGGYRAAEYRRIGKGGKEVWIQGTYVPIMGEGGVPVKVVELATDVTAQKRRQLEDAGRIAAIDRAQAVIEFELDGTIVAANRNFLNALGYEFDEIQGRHHGMFVSPDERESEAYRAFWASLNRGEYQSGEYKRFGKNGREVWILASYNPILDNGRPFRVVKFASDVTEQKLRNAYVSGQIQAIEKAQAVIEFNLDGAIETANENFLRAVGYSLAEIRGRHHGIFVDAAERDSAAYREFWNDLNRGRYHAGEYRRIGKGGREVWIQASYNPILDLNGKPFRVVKYATDITPRILARKKSERVAALLSSVAAGAEELNASIREISEAMSKSRAAANDVATRVVAADEQAKRLKDAADAMSGIVEIIGKITDQINLLALNATIESARAGEAGRGFAVVASEVKSLAAQAKSATDKIAAEIGTLNGVSNEVVTALVDIRESIHNVANYVTATAAAVEQQGDVTSEMSGSMQRAAVEAADISQ